MNRCLSIQRREGSVIPNISRQHPQLSKLRTAPNYREDFSTLSDPHESWNPLRLFELELYDATLDLELAPFEDVFDVIVRRAELFPKLRGLGSELLSLAADPDHFQFENNPTSQMASNCSTKMTSNFWTRVCFRLFRSNLVLNWRR